MNNYLIYKHTSPSGKSYIGQTTNYEQRCKKHQRQNGCRAFHSAIKRYGWDNFTHEILHENLTIDQANELEAKYILEYNTLAPNGYNLRTGGLNSKASQETRDKLSLASKNISQETRDKMSLAKKNISQETRDKLSLAKKGKIPSQKTRAKIGLTRKANIFEKIKQQYLQVTLTETNYSANRLAKLLSCRDHTISSYLNPTTRNNLGYYIIPVQQIHDYFNQPNPYILT